jgi:hypothetical protein
MILAVLLAAAAHAGPVPHPGSKSDAPITGRYAVRQGALTVCTIELSFEPTVGGQVEASENCLRPLLDASRWEPSGKGGFVLRDVLRREVATAVEDQFGYTLFVNDVRRFDLRKLPPPRMRSDAERASGWWSVRTEDPAKVDCRIELKPNGQVGPAPCAAVRSYGGGRWNADANGVRLIAAGGQAIAFRWGDAVSLIGPRGTVLLTHD